MKRTITVQGCLGLTVAALLVVTTGYAGRGMTGPQAEGSVRLAVSISDPIQILSGDGVTPLASGDAIDFGTVEVDYWGTLRMAPQKIFVANSSTARQRVTVTGALSDGLFPLFGPTPDNLNSAPDNTFVLGPQGTDADTKMGWVGLEFHELTTGGKSTTITFEATDLTEDPPVNAIGFEDPTLGELCTFANALPLRDEYLQSHGVEFRGATPSSKDGLAVLHECGNFKVDSHSTGDYFLAGSPTAGMATSGVPWLPEVISFTHPVSELSLYACGCLTSLGYTLSLTGHAGPGATGAELAGHSQLTTRGWQLWTITAPENASFRSVVLQAASSTGTLVVDDLEWRWAE